MKTPVYTGIVILLLLWAFLARVEFVYTDRLGPDEALYGWYAKLIAENPAKIFSRETLEFHPPLWPCLLSLSHVFTNKTLIACRYTAVAVNLLGLILIYLIGRRLKSRFLGVFAALSLAFNYFYFLWAFSLTIDSPLTVCLLGVFLCLLQIRDGAGLKPHILTGLLASAAILLKWSGLVVFPAVLASYFFLPLERPLKRKMTLAGLPLSMAFLTALFLAAMNVVHLGTVFPNTSAVAYRSSAIGLLGHYIRNLKTILVVPHYIPLFLYSLFVVVRSGTRQTKMLLAFFTALFIAVSLTPVKDWRYSLLFAPFAILLAGIGLETLIEKFVKSLDKLKRAKTTVLFLMAVFFVFHSRGLYAVMRDTSSRVTGYREAADWIKAHDTGRTMVIAESPRMIRYHTGIEFQEFGGRIIELPRNKHDFEDLVRNTPGHILLEVDFWSETRGDELPSMLNRAEEQRYFGQFGFVPVQEVIRIIDFANGKKKFVRAVRIFERK